MTLYLDTFHAVTGLRITFSANGLLLGSASIWAHYFNHSYTCPLSYMLFFPTLLYIIILINQV